jgi:Tfp pilus assembly protein PilW
MLQPATVDVLERGVAFGRGNASGTLTQKMASTDWHTKLANVLAAGESESTLPEARWVPPLPLACTASLVALATKYTSTTTRARIAKYNLARTDRSKVQSPKVQFPTHRTKTTLFEVQSSKYSS